jgi:predicted DNA-binding transcriptional regulator AlpA
MNSLLMVLNAAQSDGRSALIGVRIVAELCGVSTRTVERWTRDGKMPLPVGPGVSQWRRSEIESWISGGCARRTPRPRKN